MANPTDRPVFWPKGHAFAYINPLDLGAVGANLIHMSDFDYNSNQPTAKTRDRGLSDDDSSDMGGSHKLPPHEERLRALRELGVTIGQNVLNQSQAEAMSKLLYSFRDIMACNYQDVPGCPDIQYR